MVCYIISVNKFLSRLLLEYNFTKLQNYHRNIAFFLSKRVVDTSCTFHFHFFLQLTKIFCQILFGMLNRYQLQFTLLPIMPQYVWFIINEAFHLHNSLCNVSVKQVGNLINSKTIHILA